MEFAAKKNSLLSSLNFVCSHLRHSFDPHCRISADDRIQIIGFDELSIAKAMPDGEIKEKGVCEVNAFVLRNIVKHSASENLIVKASDSGLEVASGSFQCNIPLLNSEFTPDHINDPEGFAVVIEDEILKHALKNTIYAAGDAFDFLNVEAGDNKLKFVATDGSRLAISYISIDYNGDPISTVIHKDSAQILLDHVRKKEWATAIFIGEKGSFGFRSEAIEYITKPVSKKFPAYEKAIPEEEEVIVKVKTGRSRLVSAFKRALLFSKMMLSVIEIKDKVLAISAKGDEGSYSEKLDADISGADNFRIGLNCKFMIQALSELVSEYVTLSFTGERTAVVVDPEEDNCMAVIMPMVLKEVS